MRYSPCPLLRQQFADFCAFAGISFRNGFGKVLQLAKMSHLLHNLMYTMILLYKVTLLTKCMVMQSLSTHISVRLWRKCSIFHDYGPAPTASSGKACCRDAGVEPSCATTHFRQYFRLTSMNFKALVHLASLVQARRIPMPPILSPSIA